MNVSKLHLYKAWPKTPQTRTWYSYFTVYRSSLILQYKTDKGLPTYLHISRRLQRLSVLNHKSLKWAFLELVEYWISKVAYANFQKEKKMSKGINIIFLENQLIFILYFSSI